MSTFVGPENFNKILEANMRVLEDNVAVRVLEERGMRRGFEQGIEQGIEQGKANTLTRIIELIESGLTPREAALQLANE